ncbi:KilA-N domain-containing protein [Escherichia albertii]|uniref:KilA-N domain-containing protein n=1 Tax=Escherichia albertii TaxID=208962 RepID=UPI0010BCBC5C|nr:KilA-N domain-containing protein [Escherichia albertii]MCZ8664669.1 KilA-N domain-containing protein [Escherichia albertii]
MISKDRCYEPLPIILKNKDGIEQLFNPDENGMYNLTDIHKRLGLPPKKSPSQWNNNHSRYLAGSGNFQSQKGTGAATHATEAATIAYAMWVSDDFYMLVLNTFVAVRNNALAAALVASNLAEEHREMMQKNSRIVERFHRWMNADKLDWQKTALICGIEKPNKAKCALIDRGYIDYYHETKIFAGVRKRITQYYPTPKGEREGIRSRDMGLMGEQLYFTRKARSWLSDVSDRVNEHAAQLKVRDFDI